LSFIDVYLISNGDVLSKN